MPKYLPNTRFSDCWSSVGEVTFYHRAGICHWKKKAHPHFPGTPSQIHQQAIHLRALQAWRELDSFTQEQWNTFSQNVPSHRPPYRKDHHITGHNLFVSAYHGFAQLRDEHTPAPKAYEELPICTCEYSSARVKNGTDISIKLRTKLEKAIDPTRYRIATRIQLTRPGYGRQPGFLRSFTATENCIGSNCIVEVLIPNYRDIWQLDLTAYQVHMRYLLIDSQTGYRNIHKKKSFIIDL